MSREMKEILDELASIDEKRSGMAPLAETAEDAEIEARENKLKEI